MDKIDYNFVMAKSLLSLWKNIISFTYSSLRTKLIIIFIAVIIIGGLLSLVVGTKIIEDTIISLAQAKVNHDLSSAWMVYKEKLNYIKVIVDLNASREGLHDALLSQQTQMLQLFFSRVREKYKLDILTLTDTTGKVIVRTRNPLIIGDDQSQDIYVHTALHNGTIAGTQIIFRNELLKEGTDLADRALIKFVPTPMAAYRPENKEERGMMLKAAAPLIRDGKTIGVLYGGILLNRNNEIVDKVKEIVFKGEKYKGQDIGTSTIFQQDLRISTNVKNEKGERAIGTRLSAEVNNAVLKAGKAWIDRAFVVKDWYITAYEPIKDLDDKIIGILYVGMLERPYIDLRNKVMLTFIGMSMLFIGLLLIILYFSTTKIVKPLQEMAVATKKIAKGDLSTRVITKSHDEVGVLAESFNRMIDDLQKAHEELTEWGRTLEKKVEERTMELKEMQDYLIQSEKLASLGKLAAGVAHEINNPLGGILLYSHLILEDIGQDSPQTETITKIIRETTRCKNIVKGLLEFSRSKEPEMTLININEILEHSLGIMEKQVLFQNITIKKLFSSTLPKIIADGSQLQQVFINIILNAAEAMNGKGDFTIQTAIDNSKKNIEITFADTGCGISKENIARIFEPFFTTKPVGQGTGLGLAISYGIVKQHKGDIKIKSEPGKSTTFTILLPIESELLLHGSPEYINSR